MAIYGTLGESSIGALDESISGTAVDVFVYDTSQDSDGGAWRKRTQHTSWYSETLNTSTRGSRKEFPGVAIIVAESGKVIIYDGDDPDMPMWMEFTSTSGQYGGIFNGRSPVSVIAKNGEISVADSLDSVIHWNFIADTIKSTASSGSWNSNRNIKGRNPSDSTNLWQNYDTGRRIVGYPLNDLAITVLPNAPVDYATGLPVPTIAVATDSGVSAIKDDGTIASTQRGANEVHSITFDEDHSQIFSWGTTSGFPRHITRLPIQLWGTSSTSSTLWTDNYFSGGNEGAGASAGSIQTAAGGFVTVANSGRHFGIDYGLGGNPDDRLVTFSPLNMTNNANQNLSAFITSSYNTGWMHGDIKGAFLSDTTVESLTGNTNLATNATQFDTDRLTSETYDDGDTSWQMVDNSGSANGYLNIRFSGLTVGQSYIISMTWDNNATLDGGYNHRIDHSDGSQTFFYHWNKTNASSETLTGVFVAKAQNSEELVFYANAITLNVSNFIVRAVDDEDRSVNNKGLQVFGTVTKSAVATGADLVAYSGFSGSNYLQQPYNSDLDFGTGDLSISFWYKMTSTASLQCLLHRGDGASGTWGSGNLIQIEMDGTDLEFQIAGPAFSPLTQVQVPIAQSATGQWQHFVGVRSNGVMSVYIDSVKYGNVASTQDATNTSARTWIGERPNSSRPASNTSMTLFRMSASAPSAEQIKKMYEDEKVFFQENAKCTLHGSSDAVTALGYDDSTNLLHAGTSSGRSDFQGLRRINNTTTAVTTAISASNGLVAEQ